MVGVTRPAASHETAAAWVDGSSAAGAYLMGTADGTLHSSQPMDIDERQQPSIVHWDLVLINLWAVLCPCLRSRDLVCVGGVSHQVRGMVCKGTKAWDLSFTRNTAQTLCLVRGGGVLAPLVTVMGGRCEALKLGHSGTDDSVLTALAQQQHSAAASLPLPAALQGPSSLPPPPTSQCPSPSPSLASALQSQSQGCATSGLLSLDVQCCGHITATPLAALAQRCAGLRVLDVQKCYGLGGDECLPLLLPHLRQLTHLNLRLAFKLDGVGLVSVAQHCPNLTHLDLRACKGVEDSGLLALSQHCPHLSHLDLWLCDKVTDTGVCAIGECCKGLKWLRLRGCARLTSRSLLSLCHGSGLEVLDLQHCTLTTQPCVRPLLSLLGVHSRSLLSLSLAYHEQLTDTFLHALLPPSHPNTQTQTQTEGQGHLEGGLLCPRLCYVNVSYCGRLSPSLLLSVSQHRTATIPSFTIEALNP